MELQHLELNDVTLAYRVQGTGPTLFLVGAPAGMAGFAPLAARLADRYTVVTHDPRGIGLSRFTADAEKTPASEDRRLGLTNGAPVTPADLARDLQALMRHITDQPALLFGSSGGAVTGLDLLARHPESVRLLVAHEPPLFALLPDADAVLARADAAFQLAASDPNAGSQAFSDLTEALHATHAPTPRPERILLPPGTPQEREKNRFFLTRMAPGTVHARPPLAALASAPLVVAAGRASIGQAARRSSEALAQALGVPLLDAPGNHLAPALEAEAFAHWLTEVLEQH